MTRSLGEANLMGPSVTTGFCYILSRCREALFTVIRLRKDWDWPLR